MSQLLILQTESTFHQLTDAINQLEHTDYIKPIEKLSGSSIGQHVRHIIEFYQCLVNGYERGFVNYDLRARNKIVEENKEFALQCIYKIMVEIKSAELKRALILQIVYNEENKPTELGTSFERELLYNVEHAIHHMAIIKIGLKEIKSEIILPAEFGVAASTIRHHQHNHVHSNLFT